jgi:ribosomal protein L44E
MRLGDYVDDYCTRCKRSTDHSIVSMMGEEVLRTRCRTCDNEHKYRANKGGKKELSAKEAFDILMARAGAGQPQEPEARPARKKKQ